MIWNRACRAFLGVHRFTSNVVVNGDMGWTVPKMRRKLNMLGLWVRLETMDDDTLTKKAYRWNRTCKNNNLSIDIKCILKKLNYGIVVALKSEYGLLEKMAANNVLNYQMFSF